MNALVRTITYGFVFLGLLSANAGAGTAWEAYLLAPSPGAAVAVQRAEYSIPDESNRRFESDLAILENEVAAGESESIKLAVRLLTQFDTAAAIAEYLSTILGRSIRPNPAGYLRSISSVQGCPGIFPSGDLFVDRSEARIAEARARQTALEGVNVQELKQKRDECIAVLGSSEN